VVTVLYQI